MIVAKENLVGVCQAVQDACCSVDMDGCILHANDAFCTMLGYDRETLLTKSARDLIPAEYLSSEAIIVEQQVRQRGFSEIYEEEFIREDGSRFPVELMRMLVTDAGGPPAGMLLMVRDITLRTRLQQELVRSREEYRTLADNSPDIVLRFDRELRHVYANPAAGRACGLSVDKLVGATLYEIGLNDQFAEVWRDRIVSVFEAGVPKKVEDSMPFSDGMKYFEYQLVPEGAVGEPPQSVMVIGRDITERTHSEKSLLEAQDELERRVEQRTNSLQCALREQEAFSYSVSHDLRAPLRHINGYLAILCDEFESSLPPEAKYLIHRTREASGRMGKLIDELLELARVGRVTLDKTAVDLSALAQGMAASLQEGEPERVVEFEIEPGITVFGDKLLLKQLVDNLLENAWKYSSQRPLARIELGRQKNGSGDVFLVRDNGVGFDTAFSHHLFRPFQRLHGPEYPGNGIGLATVQRIIDRHGGSIWADSVINEGATFFFKLPHP